MNKSGERHVELLEAREDATKAVQTAKQPFDFISPFVDRFAVVPSCKTVGLGRHDRNKSQIERQLPRFGAQSMKCGRACAFRNISQSTRDISD